MDNNYCEYIHKLFNSYKRNKFPFDKNEVAENGIYILFERGEKAHSVDRIVRIGTHTGEKQLRSRLNQHFMLENKDRSIFRKNIGRAILNKNNDKFLKYWELDLTTKDARNQYSEYIDMEKQNKIEREVSEYIQSNFTFVILKINNKDIRLTLESKIISTVSLCNECKQSKKWLGNYSPKDKIRKSGLWLVNELWKEPLCNEDLEYIKY